jgi:hypothetical protein
MLAYTDTKTVTLGRPVDNGATTVTTTIEQLKRDNAQYLWHPMAHPQAHEEDRRPTSSPAARAAGCGTWTATSCSTAWRPVEQQPRPQQPPVRDAIVAQLDELPFYNTFRGTTHPRAIELSPRAGEADAARRRGRGDVQQRRLGRGGRRAEDRAPVLEAARPGRPQQVHQPAPGLPRRAFRRHERQRQHQLPPRLRAAAAGLLPRRHALAVPQPYTDDRRAGRWAASAPRSSSARSSSRAPTPWPPSSPSRCRAPAA